MAEKKKKKRKGITAKAKKKTAIARAVIRKGSGIVKVNNRNIETIQPTLIYDFLREPCIRCLQGC